MITIKIGDMIVQCFSQAQIDKIPFHINNTSRVYASNILTKDIYYNRYISESTMGALDNWARHEDVNVYFSPIKEDLFNDLVINLYKKDKETGFVMNLPKEDKRTNVADFLRELYVNVVESSKKMMK